MRLDHKHILLGVTGSIAAYKAAYLVRELRRLGAEVRVILSPAAARFVGAATFQALSGHPVAISLFEAEAGTGMRHIDLARWSDLFLIAPASANTIARMAQGAADDLIALTHLAGAAPVAVAPAMNRMMWEHPALQANLETLRTRSVMIWGPASGEQACAEEGEGRMLEAGQLAVRIGDFFGMKILAGRQVLVTAGPTHESVDGVRCLSNYSSGKMGFALAQAACELGAEVTLVSGPVALPTPASCRRVDVVSAQQMYQAVMDDLPGTDMMIACAAVADYTPKTPQASKIKSGHDTLVLDLVGTKDIVVAVAQSVERPFLVGFAAETEAVTANAKRKLLRKNLDMIVANRVGPDTDYGFGSDDNAVSVYWRGGESALGPSPKTLLGRQLMTLFAEHFQAGISNDGNRTAQNS